MSARRSDRAKSDASRKYGGNGVARRARFLADRELNARLSASRRYRLRNSRFMQLGSVGTPWRRKRRTLARKQQNSHGLTRRLRSALSRARHNTRGAGAGAGEKRGTRRRRDDAAAAAAAAVTHAVRSKVHPMHTTRETARANLPLRAIIGRFSYIRVLARSRSPHFSRL